MARKVFFSFHYKPDNWRASQVRNIGVIEGNKAVSDNKWEEVKKGGDKAIQKWIDDNIYEKSCCVVLVGEKTTGRKWIKYEIRKAWKDGKGVVGICIHNLKDISENQSNKGKNPFEDFSIEVDGKKKSFAKVVKLYDPPYKLSKNVYNNISKNIEDWVEEAIEIRHNNE
ncbi:MAG: TIR domain-containing protein [Bacteroidales bacterium]|nr:TIR domain-containing protein [Bacteroidales bacterium]